MRDKNWKVNLRGCGGDSDIWLNDADLIQISDQM